MREYDRRFVPYYLQEFLDNPEAYLIMKDFSPFTLSQLGIIWAKFQQVAQNHPNTVNLQQLSPYFTNTLIIGDTHGDLKSTMKIVQPFFDEKVDALVFMGDYVDRGEYGFLNLMFIIGLCIAWPDRVVLLRGNHEDFALNTVFGFYEELQRYFVNTDVLKAVISIIKAFYNLMSVIAITPRQSMCVHAGIPKIDFDLSLLNQIPKPHQNFKFYPDERIKKKWKTVFTQLRWNDPTEQEEVDENAKSYHGYYFYTQTEVVRFLKLHHLARIYRSHEHPRGGYEEVFPRKLYYIFSNAPYFGKIPTAYMIHETPEHIYLRDIEFNHQQTLL